MDYVEDYPYPGETPSDVPAYTDVTPSYNDPGVMDSIVSALGNISPGLLGALLGAVGPVAGLVGNLAGGGISGTQNQSQTGSQSGYQNQTGSQTGQTSQATTTAQQGTRNQTQTTGQTGYQNTTQTPTLDPRAVAAADRLTDFLSGGYSGEATTAASQALGMLQQLAAGGGGVSASAPSAPRTTPTPAAVTGFPGGVPTEYNEGLGNLIKQAFEAFQGDLASGAIQNARARGFSGGADLLQTAAAPIAGPALARMPAEMAKAYLEHVLQAYTAQGNVAAQENAARAGALNAATNALGPGVSVYGQDIAKYLGELNAGNQAIANKASLLTALMGPQQQMINANLGLMNALPHGMTANTLSGSEGTQTLSGTDTSNTQQASAGTSAQQSNQAAQSGSQSQGSQTGSSSVPLGPVIGAGIGNIAGGAASGYANATQPSLLQIIESLRPQNG